MGDRIVGRGLEAAFEDRLRCRPLRVLPERVGIVFEIVRPRRRQALRRPKRGNRLVVIDACLAIGDAQPDPGVRRFRVQGGGAEKALYRRLGYAACKVALPRADQGGRPVGRSFRASRYSLLAAPGAPAASIAWASARCAGANRGSRTTARSRTPVASP